MKFISILIILLFAGCDNEQFSGDYVNFLKDSGYKSLYCDLSYNDAVKSYDFTAEVIPVSNHLEMLLARCKKNECEFEVIEDNSTPIKILCQRYYNNENFNSEFDKDQIVLTFNTEYFLDIKE